MDAIVSELDPAAQRAFALLSGVTPLALEGCLRVPAAPSELVAGFGIAQRGLVLAATELVAPGHAARVARWSASSPAIRAR